MKKPQTEFRPGRASRPPTSPSSGFSFRLASGPANGLLMAFKRVRSLFQIVLETAI